MCNNDFITNLLMSERIFTIGQYLMNLRARVQWHLFDSQLSDSVKLLCRTRHKIDHCGDVLPSQSLGIVLKKLKLNLTQQKHTYAIPKS